MPRRQRICPAGRVFHVLNRAVARLMIFEKPADYVASKRTLTTLCVPASERLANRANQRPMKDWSSVGKMRFQPKPGSDLTKVIFAEFQWATNKPDVVPQPKANDR